MRQFMPFAQKINYRSWTGVLAATHNHALFFTHFSSAIYHRQRYEQAKRPYIDQFSTEVQHNERGGKTINSFLCKCTKYAICTRLQINTSLMTVRASDGKSMHRRMSRGKIVVCHCWAPDISISHCCWWEIVNSKLAALLPLSETLLT